MEVTPVHCVQQTIRVAAGLLPDPVVPGSRDPFLEPEAFRLRKVVPGYGRTRVELWRDRPRFAARDLAQHHTAFQRLVEGDAGEVAMNPDDLARQAQILATEERSR